VEETRSELTAIGIRVIECADLVQENPNAVILSAAGFQPFCELTHQRAVFLYRRECDVHALIHSMIEEVCEMEEDPASLIRAFEKQHTSLVERANVVCAKHFYAEFTVLYQGGFVSTGVVCQTYEDLLEALQSFCQGAEDRRDEANEAQAVLDEATLDELASELMRDPGFAAVRGKRKRCVYVTQEYGFRVPRSPTGELRRVDHTCDPMDANLVKLVERVSDLLELGRT
jgi:hypothetical protein